MFAYENNLEITNIKKIIILKYFWKFSWLKFASRVHANAIWIFFNWKFWIFFEIQIAKMRENDLDIKIIKILGFRIIFRGSKSISHGRHRDFDTMQNI